MVGRPTGGVQRTTKQRTTGNEATSTSDEAASDGGRPVGRWAAEAVGERGGGCRESHPVGPMDFLPT